MCYRNLPFDNEITIIIPLYKTPIKKINLIKQYKNFKVLVLDQCPEKNTKQKIQNLNIKYYSSKKNLGLSKATNFLLNKVKTKYCLFTQADIEISFKSIELLKLAIERRKDTIFAGPKFIKNKSINISLGNDNYKIVNNLNAACMLCDTVKLKKIGFFDEDFFLYWEDIFLMDKINKSNYKMIFVPNANVIHAGGKSTDDNYKIKFIRTLNFKYGEFLYDYKMNKFRIIKVMRQLFQSILFLLLNILTFNFPKILKFLAFILGIIKFLKFILIKKFFYLLNF
jgi:GT2 family glycosyltransferase